MSSRLSGDAKDEAKFSSATPAAEPPTNQRPPSIKHITKDSSPSKEKLPVEDAVEVDADLEDENDPEISQIPPEVRRVVSLHDDTTLPTLTFRYFVLSILFVIPGAFLSSMNSYRTTYAPYSVFFVQIASNYVGLWLARVLPNRQFRIPFTRWSFNMNPGPWSVKEHVLITLTAASGATGNGGTTPIALGDLYFNERLHPAAAIFFMWSIDATGYAFAALARQILLYEPAYPWFQALCQAALFETQSRQNKNPTPTARKQMRVFWWVLLGITLWQFLPEYAFPMLNSMAFLCWVAPHNPVANFIGSGLGANPTLPTRTVPSSPYAFLVGAACPAIIYTLHRLFPRAKFHLFNTTIFFSGASIFYGNVSTGYFSRFIGGFVVMFWAYRYRYQLWAKYNFILAAAFDAGFNLNMLLIFLIFGSAKVIGMPNWWGNDAASVEKCYALE
ncbi:Oligopeptide transporter 8 [Daldinia childiae]|uniref:Oligopeptide transporter 8 n=1 Tax=Daldinia childiae TaxID=326645 RepID=UPI0014452419|nr:Oligopeptide transporter 8 [Daldinia childiae]KAF3057955.1 Oligopeptide transporter 8 [Daldinia childiae]